ncbi:MAG: ACP S-malonyltransferase [Lachnospiraceae bacterium]
MSKIAFLFPGQGAQKAGMGKDFYEQSQTAKTVYDHASKILDLDMPALCFEENEKLDMTEYTQTALVTTCIAMTKVLKEQGITPDVAAGLSLGEYVALWAAGGMAEQDAIALVRKRGIFMQEAVPEGAGAMAAILGLNGEQIEVLIKEIKGVTIANYNCPGQVVITGETKAVELAGEIVKQNGAKRVVLLNVSGPFHSPMLQGAGNALANILEPIQLQPLQIPYVTNVTAKYITDIQETKKLLSKQVASSVRWQQSVEAMLNDGVDTFVEIGPGKTLAGFMRKINRDAHVINVGTWEDIEKAVGELRC